MIDTAADTHPLANARATRRDMLRLGAGAAVLGLGGTRLRAQGKTKISQHVWTGAQEIVPQRIAAEFFRDNPGVDITVTPGASGVALNRIKASLEVGGNDPAFNFGFFNLENTERGLIDKIWQPLDKALVPNLDNIDDTYRRPNDVGAFFCLDLGGIIYNKEKIKEPPASWRDLWNPKYKGRVAMFDNFWTGNGLIATARVNGGGEDNIEPALKIYEEAAKSGHIHSFFTSNAQIQQLLISGEVWLAPHFRGIVLPWIKEGAPFGYAIPKEGQIAFPEGFQLIRGGSPEQARVSQQLINRSLTTEAVLDYSLTAAVVPALKNVSLPAEIAADPAVQPAALKNAIQLDYAKIAASSQAWSNAWNRRVKANLR